MSGKLEKKLEKILHLLERLGKEAAKGAPIIVEGKNDVQALQKLDVNGDFILAKTAGKSFLDTLSEVEKKEKQEVILLMDFDKRGKELTKRLIQYLEKMRIKPNSFFWKELLSLVRREVKDIEGLATYAETLKKKCGV